jgi:transcriptional regulator with XRE-family HTH domain
VQIACELRRLRGARTIRQLEQETGISRGQLSLYERGRAFPADKHVPLLERVYGAPLANWYPPRVVIELAPDSAE